MDGIEPTGASCHYLSPGFERIWGFPGQDVMRDRELWLKAIHPEDLPRVLRWAKDMREGGRV